MNSEPTQLPGEPGSLSSRNMPSTSETNTSSYAVTPATLSQQPIIQRKLTRGTGTAELLDTLPFSLRVYLRWSSLLRRKNHPLRRIFLSAAVFGCFFFIGLVGGWNANETIDPVDNSTTIVYAVDPREIKVGSFFTLLGFLLFCPQWVASMSQYLSDGGVDLAQHWQTFPRHDPKRVRSLSRVGNASLGVNILFTLLIFVVAPPFLAESWRQLPEQTPLIFYLYFFAFRLVPLPCMFLCTFPVVFLIAPLFKLITEAQVVAVRGTFQQVKECMHDGGGGGGKEGVSKGRDKDKMNKDHAAKEQEHKEKELAEAEDDLPTQISEIVSRESQRFEKANSEMSSAAASIMLACILWFVGITMDQLLKLFSGEPFVEDPNFFLPQLAFQTLLYSFFVGIPVVVLQKCIVPGAEWERLCRTLYEPRNAWVFARRVKGLYSVRDFHHGMELHARDFGWRFFGVQMTASVFRAISGGMLTLIGVLAAAIFRSMEI